MNFERIVLSVKSNTVLPPLLGRVCVGRWRGEADIKMCSEGKDATTKLHFCINCLHSFQYIRSTSLYSLEY